MDIRQLWRAMQDHGVDVAIEDVKDLGNGIVEAPLGIGTIRHYGNLWEEPGYHATFGDDFQPIRAPLWQLIALAQELSDSLPSALAERLADPDDEGGPEVVMTSLGYAELWTDGEVVMHGQVIARIEAST